MPRILSQVEIDALLSAVAPSQPVANRDQRSVSALKRGRAVPYDFKHPNRVSKDQIRKLETIHDSFAGALGTSLSTIQRALVDVALLAVDQITYTEFIASLQSPSCSYTFRMPPLEGMCVVDFHPTLAFAIVDRLFGGRGASLETQRELTGMERAVMQRIAVRVLDQLAVSWHRVIDATAEIVGCETNPQFLQVVGPGETVIVITLQLNMAAAGGSLTICYPYVALESVLERLAAQSWTERSRRGRIQTDRVSVEAMVRRVAVPVDGQLADTEIALGDLLAMEPGAIIPLPLRVGEAITLRVAGEKKFTGTLGTVGRRRAVRIKGPLLSESDGVMEEHRHPENPEEQPGAQSESSVGGAFRSADELIRELREAAGADVSPNRTPHAELFARPGEPGPATPASEGRTARSPQDRVETPKGGSVDIKMPTGPSAVRKTELDAQNRPPAVPAGVSGIDRLMDVNLPVSIELGRTQLSISEILKLGSGSIVELDKLAGEPVDILVNNVTLAKGEVVVLDEHFGVRITSLVSRRERVNRLGA